MFNLKVNLSGLKCNACIKLVKSRIGKISGIKNVDVDLSGKVDIVSERIVTKDEIKLILSGTDFEVI